MAALTVVRTVAGTLCRGAALLVLVLVGTVSLVRTAPGYFTDTAELDSAHAASARLRTAVQQAREGSVLESTCRAALAALRGDLGDSREYGVSVRTLLRSRAAFTASLLLRGMVLGWLLAAAGTVLSSSGHAARLLPRLLFAVLLAIPSAALATVCILRQSGGPVLVLTLVVAARDFQFLHRLLAGILRSPALLYARAAGVGPARLLWAHMLPAAMPQIRALVPLSIVTALSALVPVEVLFDAPGLAQLAWSAAGNRDLPVLLAVTLIMAAVVVATGALAGSARSATPMPEPL